MGHGESSTDKLIATRRYNKFMKTWIRNPTFYPAAFVMLSGVVAVATIAIHHFGNNNAVMYVFDWYNFFSFYLFPLHGFRFVRLFTPRIVRYDLWVLFWVVLNISVACH